MAWNENQADAQRLMFEQFLDPKKLIDQFKNAQDEWRMAVGSGSMRNMEDLKALKKGKPNGKYLRVDYKTAQNTYAAARPAGVDAYLPGANPNYAGDQVGQLKTLQGIFKPTNVYMGTGWDGPARAAVKSPEGGYGNVVSMLTEDAMEGMLARLSINMAGTRLGILGKIKTNNVSSDYTQVLIEWTNTAGAFSGVQNFLQGQIVVDAVASLAGAMRITASARARRVLTVAKDIGTSAGVLITLDSAHNASGTGWSDGDYLVMFDTRITTAIPNTADGYETGLYGFYGMLDAVDDGTYAPWYGRMQRSANPTIASTVMSNGGTLRPFSPILLNDAIDNVFQLYGARESPPILYGRQSIAKKAMEFAIKTVSTNFATDTPTRYQGDKEVGSLKLGFNSLEMAPFGVNGKVRFWASRNAPTHQLTGFYAEDLEFWYDGAPEWIDKNTENAMRQAGRHVYQAGLWARIMGYVNKTPARHFRIDDLDGSHIPA